MAVKSGQIPYEINFTEYYGTTGMYREHAKNV